MDHFVMDHFMTIDHRPFCDGPFYDHRINIMDHFMTIIIDHRPGPFCDGPFLWTIFEWGKKVKICR
jgi:CDGSH-type Zn-finger protein